MPLQQLAIQPEAAALNLDEAGRPLVPLLVVDADAPASADEIARAVARLAQARAIVVVVAQSSMPAQAILDVADLCLVRPMDDVPRSALAVADPAAELNRLQGVVQANPIAALTLTWLLRGSTELPVPEALAMESAAYSMLLAGAEFRTWLNSRGAPRARDDGKRVNVTRIGDVLSVVLDRPHRRNAVDAAMRDELVAALHLAEVDTELDVVITGNGPIFSTGGDLDEFGTAKDPALAHLVRTVASAGEILHRIRDRVTVEVHGLCMGAGVELPAFAGRVVAAPDTEFVLPEVGMGLIPGAGGTVSLPRRIGRHRALWLALTGHQLSVELARDWGLVDEVG